MHVLVINYFKLYYLPFTSDSDKIFFNHAGTLFETKRLHMKSAL